MKKRTLIPALLASLLMVQTAFAAPASLYIDNEKVAYTEKSGVPFLDENERTQVPLRASMEAFGCEVSWQESRKTAVLTKDGTTVEVPTGKKYILVNGTQRTNDTTSRIKDGRIYLPIRAVLEAFGAEVRWDGSKNAVLVYDSIQAPAGQPLTVHFMDVGQADAILIDYGKTEVLIDGGNNQDGKKVVSYLSRYVDGPLELMIATHPHADHIGGLDDVLAAYSVLKIIDSGDTATSKTYRDYISAAHAEPNCKFTYDADAKIPLGQNAVLTIIETGDGYKDPNDNSVLARLDYGETSVLFTGDMEAPAEAAALPKLSHADVLKVGHHGSKTSTTDAFLDRVSPQYAVISAGKNNRYHHPNQAVLQKLSARGIHTYGTFKSGDIVLTTDGTSCSFNTNTPLWLSDAGDR